MSVLDDPSSPFLNARVVNPFSRGRTMAAFISDVISVMIWAWGRSTTFTVVWVILLFGKWCVQRKRWNDIVFCPKIQSKIYCWTQHITCNGNHQFINCLLGSSGGLTNTILLLTLPSIKQLWKLKIRSMKDYVWNSSCS